jgi:hypothetical protein
MNRLYRPVLACGLALLLVGLLAVLLSLPATAMPARARPRRGQDAAALRPARGQRRVRMAREGVVLPSGVEVDPPPF